MTLTFNILTLDDLLLFATIYEIKATHTESVSPRRQHICSLKNFIFIILEGGLIFEEVIV